MKRAQVDAFCGSRATVYQRVAAIVAPAILAGACVYLLAVWRTLPEVIPTHFNFAGEVDGWGSRGTLWLMPIIGALIDLTIAVTGRFPRSWNTGVRVTVFNRTRVYRIVRDLLADLRLACASMFALLSVWMSHVTEGLRGGLPLAVCLLLIFAPILRYTVRILRAR